MSTPHAALMNQCLKFFDCIPGLSNFVDHEARKETTPYEAVQHGDDDDEDEEESKTFDDGLDDDFEDWGSSKKSNRIICKPSSSVFMKRNRKVSSSWLVGDHSLAQTIELQESTTKEEYKEPEVDVDVSLPRNSHRTTLRNPAFFAIGNLQSPRETTTATAKPASKKEQTHTNKPQTSNQLVDIASLNNDLLPLQKDEGDDDDPFKDMGPQLESLVNTSQTVDISAAKTTPSISKINSEINQMSSSQTSTGVSVNKVGWNTDEDLDLDIDL